MNPFEHGEVFVTDDGGETDLDLGPLRAVHRREPVAGLERHHRLDLLGRARRRAPGRLPRQDRPGDPAHHRRDQAAHHPARRRRRRRRDHRGRRHRRRHRDPPVPRGHPAVPPRRRPGQRLLRPRHAGAVHRAVGRAEDQAHPALGHRAAQPGHPARRHRVPVRGAAVARTSSARSPTCATCPPTASSTAPTPATSTRSRSCSTRRASTTEVCAILRLEGHEADLTEWEALVDRVEAATKPVRIGIIGKYVSLIDAYLSVVEATKHGGFHHGAKVEIDWIQAEDVEGLLAAGRLHDLDGIVIPGGFGERGIEGKIAAAELRPRARHPVPRAVPRPAGDGHRVRPQRARPHRRQLHRDRRPHAAPGHRPHGRASATSPTRAARCASVRTSPSWSRGRRWPRPTARTVVSERHRHRYEFNPRYHKRVRGRRTSGCRASRPTTASSSSSSSTGTRSGSAPRPTPSSRAAPTGRPRCSASFVGAALRRAEDRAPHLFEPDGHRAVHHDAVGGAALDDIPARP